MSNESSAGGVLAIILTILLVVFIGVIVLGVGGIFAFRSVAMERQLHVQEALVAEQIVEQHHREAERRAEIEPQDATQIALAEIESGNVEAAAINIVLDAGGKLTVDGLSVANEDLDRHLRERHASEAALPSSVSIRAARSCEFRHVANVISVCREIGLRASVLPDEPEAH